jgi:hypothetical protein
MNSIGSIGLIGLLVAPAIWASKAPPKSNSQYGITGEIVSGPTSIGGGITVQTLCGTDNCPDQQGLYHYVFVYQIASPSPNLELIVSDVQVVTAAGSFYCDPDQTANLVLCTPVQAQDPGLNAITYTTPDNTVVFTVPQNTPGCSPDSPYTGGNTAETGCLTLFVEEDLAQAPPPPPTPQITIVVRSDFNTDTHPDIIWQDPVAGGSQVFYLGGPQGASILGAEWISGENSWRIAAVADFNGDGHPDLVWQDPVTGETQVWFLNGSQGTSILAAVALAPANPWRIVAVGDFNRDGYPDLVWQDPESGHAQIWYLGGPRVSRSLMAGPSER